MIDEIVIKILIKDKGKLTKPQKKDMDSFTKDITGVIEKRNLKLIGKSLSAGGVLVLNYLKNK